MAYYIRQLRDYVNSHFRGPNDERTFLLNDPDLSIRNHAERDLYNILNNLDLAPEIIGISNFQAGVCPVCVRFFAGRGKLEIGYPPQVEFQKDPLADYPAWFFSSR